MGGIRVVDRGSKEIVVFLAGDVGRGMEQQFGDALAEISLLERLDDLHCVVVDTREVTALDEIGVDFLHRLQRNGQAEGYELEFAMLTGPARTALDQYWPAPS